MTADQQTRPSTDQLDRIRETIKPTIEEWLIDYSIERDKSHGQLENRIVAAVAAIQQGGLADKMRDLLLRLEECHLGNRAFDEAAVYEVYRDAQALLAKLDGESCVRLVSPSASRP